MSPRQPTVVGPAVLEGGRGAARSGIEPDEFSQPQLGQGHLDGCLIVIELDEPETSALPREAVEVKAAEALPVLDDQRGKRRAPCGSARDGRSMGESTATLAGARRSRA